MSDFKQYLKNCSNKSKYTKYDRKKQLIKKSGKTIIANRETTMIYFWNGKCVNNSIPKKYTWCLKKRLRVLTTKIIISVSERLIVTNDYAENII